MTEYLRDAASRERAILQGTSDKFYFETQPFAAVGAGSIENQIDLTTAVRLVSPLAAVIAEVSGGGLLINAQDNNYGKNVVSDNSAIIERASAKYGIDQNIAKAIIYTEASRGFYGVVFDQFGVSKTILPGNIDAKWAALIPGSDINKISDNIEVSVKLISEIAKRLDDPVIENIYSLYNSLSHDRTYVNAQTKTTPYFAKLALEARAWEQNDWNADHYFDIRELKCFPAGTPIRMGDGTELPIEDVKTGDIVLAFDGEAELGRGDLVPRRVTNTFVGTTLEWITLRDKEGRDPSFRLTVTPGHHFLSSGGEFRKIEDILKGDAKVVLASGATKYVEAERLVYSDTTASLFESNQFPGYVAGIGVGWKTYNFEVEELHTYVAHGIRVHNKSIIDYLPEGAKLNPLAVVIDSTTKKATKAGYWDKDGTYSIISGTPDANGNTNLILEERIIPSWVAEGNGATIGLRRVLDPVTGQETSRDITSIEYEGTVIQLESIGNALGSIVGSAIGGNTVTGRVLASTFVGTLAQNLGEVIQKGFKASSLLDAAPNGSAVSPLTNALNLTFVLRRQFTK